jgi:CheY-like chemotaxis protein
VRPGQRRAGGLRWSWVTKKLVLVIEDDDDIREAVCELLDARGFDVVAAHTARLGMSILEAGLRPSLILLDIRMAGFNGVDFRRAQLADAALRRIPVVAMTAIDVLADHPELTWTAVLRKPIVGDQLIECLIAALQVGSRATVGR